MRWMSLRKWRITLQRDPTERSEDTPARKADHVRINLERDVAAKGIASGFDEFRLIHSALPEIDLAQVDTSTALFGRTLGAPILISCMTGGTPLAAELNRVLARVAQKHRFAMGLGSARALIERPELIDTFDVRALAPDVLLLANIGAVQLNKGYGAEQCGGLVQTLRADALVLHLNAIQEALQPEGDTCFRGLLERIAKLCSELDVPVIVKEVGWGIAPDTVQALFDAGVAAIDLAGAGGTSWSEVERHRIAEVWRANAAAAFAGWGIPTAECLRAARSRSERGVLIASGGIRNGIDIVKALCLGAQLVGMAAPFLKAASQGYDVANDLARELHEVLRVAMFALGARCVDDMRATKRILHYSEKL
jgi:isopentenyl-diphosphate Delta-isomerase